MFDTVSMPPHIKVAEVGRLMERAYRNWDARVFEGYLHRFKLDSKKAIKELSRGMGMKLSLACALAHDPQVLILDEATAGLDPMARDEVLDMLREFVAVEDAAGNPQHAILMSSHITSDLDKIATAGLDPMARDEVLDMLREFVAVEDAAGNPQHAILMSSHITSDLDKIADTVVCIDDGRIVFACDKDEICDLMGVARCRAAEVEQVLANDQAPSEVRVLHHDYGVDVLVPDRFEFMRAFPQIPCDRVSIDDYMALALKGAVLHPRAGAQEGGDAR